MTTATAPLQHTACHLTDAAVQTYYDIGVAHYRVAEDHFFSSLTGMKDPFACSRLLHTGAGFLWICLCTAGVEVALANPNITTAALAGLALITLPGKPFGAQTQSLLGLALPKLVQ